MKVAIAFLALVALGYSAPQPRKLFHEHWEDFTKLIFDTAGHDIDHLLEHYLEFEEFQTSLDYLMTPSFRNLVYEMEDIPDFKAAVEFMESHGIDIKYFLDAVNAAIDGIQGRSQRSVRHTLSGRDMTSFIKDSISEFPKTQLTALLNEKLAEDAEFRSAMESFDSEEWTQLYEALWNNETFLNEVATLKENGIDVDILLVEAKAVVGIY